ncbi:MAG: ribosome biogenesis GTPase Der, partial [Leptolyngbya sp. ERB_1_2]
RQGKIYYGTQVSTAPPTIALFVNDPHLFNDNYRRYIDRKFRESLGFQGTPLRLLWRGKKVREVERNTANRATKV